MESLAFTKVLTIWILAVTLVHVRLGDCRRIARVDAKAGHALDRGEEGEDGHEVIEIPGNITESVKQEARSEESKLSTPTTVQTVFKNPSSSTLAPQLLSSAAEKVHRQPSPPLEPEANGSQPDQRSDTPSTKLSPNVTVSEGDLEQADKQFNSTLAPLPILDAEQNVSQPSGNGDSAAAEFQATTKTNAKAATSIPTATTQAADHQVQTLLTTSDDKLANRPRWQLLHRKQETNVSNNRSHSPELVNEYRKPKPIDHYRRRNRPRYRSKWHWFWESFKSTVSSSLSPRISVDDQNQTIADSSEGAAMISSEESSDTFNQTISEKINQSIGNKSVTPLKRKLKHRKECTSCKKWGRSLREARELYKQVLKDTLLDKLQVGSSSPPPDQWRPKLPDQVFRDGPQGDQAPRPDQYYARPKQLLVFGTDLGPQHRLKKAATGSYQFGVTGKVKGVVTRADLWVYKMRDARDAHGQTLVVTELSFSRRRRLRERSLVARLDTRVQEGWLRFDLTRLVRRWLKSGTPPSLQMLAIRCKTCHRNSYRTIFGIKSNFRPVLIMQEHSVTEGQQHRDKRSLCDPGSGCCKFDLTLEFHNMGLHRILEPRQLRAGYCYGNCNRPDAYHYNHTSIIQVNRFNSHSPVSDEMRDRMQPCCVPVVLREASVMYYFNDGYDVRESVVPNLLVEKCGCA